MSREIYMTAGIRASVIEGVVLPHRPRFALGGMTVLVTDANNALERDAKFARTIGTGDFLDIDDLRLRFSQASGLLDSLDWKLASQPLLNFRLTESWDRAPSFPGLPRLLEPTSFSLSTEDFGCSLDGRASYHLIDDEPARHKTSYRLKFADSCEFLVNGRKLAGIRLFTPVRHLVRSWEQPRPEQTDDQLGEWFMDYIHILDQLEMELASDRGDITSSTLNRLKVLVNSINPFGGDVHRRGTIRDAARELIDAWS